MTIFALALAQEGVSHGGHQGDDQEGSRPGPDESVVEADHGTDEAGDDVVAVARVPERRQLTDIRFQGGEERDGDQRHHDDGLEDSGRQGGRQAGAAKTARQGYGCHGDGGPKVRPHPPVVRRGTGGGSEDGAHLVGGQGLDRRNPGNQEQRRKLDESSAAHHRVNPACCESSHHNQDDRGELD